MNDQFSDPMSAKFTKKHAGTTFSDVRRNSFLKKILAKLGITPHLKKPPHGSWLW